MFLTSAVNGGELHVPAVLPNRKKPPVRIGEDAGGNPQPVWTRRRWEISPPKSGIELRPSRP